MVVWLRCRSSRRALRCCGGSRVRLVQLTPNARADDLDWGPALTVSGISMFRRTASSQEPPKDLLLAEGTRGNERYA